MYFYDEVTYIKNPLTRESEFRSMKPVYEELPGFESSRRKLPEPLWEGHQNAINCYWKAWELAFSYLRKATPENRFVRNFIDSGLNDHLFMWDSAFVFQYGKYGMRAFNFIETLDNFYARQHPDGFICREIREDTGEDCFQRHDPTSTGPNVMAWVEWDHFTIFQDRERLRKVYPALVAYYQWLKMYRTWPDGTYWSSGWGTGMDNQPRQEVQDVDIRSKEELRSLWQFSHGHMAWIEACLQQILSARLLVKIAEVIGREEHVGAFREECDFLTRFVNEKMWDDEKAYYYDRYRDGRLSTVKSIGSYWALLADVVPPERLERFVAHLQDTGEFNRPHRAPSLSADNPEYHPGGSYWLGGVWPPTNYMVMRGLSRTGHDDLAHEIGKNHLDNVVKVFDETGTVWENYAPESAAPGSDSKADLVGWSALGPVAVLLEYVFGISPRVPESKIIWKVRLLEGHGVKNYQFGRDGIVDLRCRSRSSQNQVPEVEVESNVPIEIEVVWSGGSRVITVPQAPGSSRS